jgi:hypothetical protein
LIKKAPPAIIIEGKFIRRRALMSDESFSREMKKKCIEYALQFFATRPATSDGSDVVKVAKAFEAYISPSKSS